jgi:DHA2 family multidrug resistance protein
MAIRSLYGRVQAQVFMLTFQEIMYIMMMVVVLAFIPLYLLKFKNKSVKVVDAH